MRYSSTCSPPGSASGTITSAGPHRIDSEGQFQVDLDFSTTISGAPADVTATI